MQGLRNALRGFVRKRLFPLFGVRRIHIVGCARSGTTMLHYAMLAFDGVVLSTTESDVGLDPGLGQSLGLVWRAMTTRAPVHYVTKRNYGWYEPDALRATIETLRAEHIGVLLLVRDPRDVLASRHAGAEQSEAFYVEPSRWMKSVAAGDALIDAVRHAVPTVTVRYEDVVANPDYAETRIVNAFGLRKNPRLQSIDKLRDNVRALGIGVDMEQALHKLRNFDRNSVQKWRSEERSRSHVLDLLSDDSPIAVSLHDFLWRHRYLPGAWSASARQQWYASVESAVTREIPTEQPAQPPTKH
ncbi:MAG: hypothetical protein AAFN78_04930 [Pseudomonadota bacterium]